MPGFVKSSIARDSRHQSTTYFQTVTDNAEIPERAGLHRRFSGGRVGSTNQNTIDYVTIQSTGNATDFGDLGVIRGGEGACDNLTRGVLSCGY